MSQTSTKNPKEIIKETINKLKEEKVYQGFPQGKKIPNFSLTDKSGNLREIFDELDNEFLIINFFRGDWCGYCKNELKELQEHFEDISELNAKVISIAPQSPSKLNKLKENLGLSFDLLSDPDLEIAKMFNLVWEVPQEIREIYLDEYDLDIPELNANGTWHLPVPATYIVNKTGSVVTKYENLNYSKRLGIEKILEVLRLNQNQ